MRFHNPEFLILLALIPVIAILLGRKGGTAAVQYSSADLVRAVARESRSRAGRWLTVLRLFALTLIVVALARPQFGRGTTEVQASGIDIVLAVDISGSMEAPDFKVNGRPTSRIEVAKSVVAKFIEARPNDRIGIVAFAGRPYLVSPLTLDHSWLLQNLERLRLGLVEDGTAIGSAIASSVNRLRDQPSKSKIVVLLTDGMNNAGKVAPEAAADAARAYGIKVYTIGAGVKGEVEVMVANQFGLPTRQKVSSDVDEPMLKKVAETTNAQFYRATDTASLEEIYGQIDRLEKTTATMKKYEHYNELFAWALIPGLLLLGMETALSNTRYRRLP